MRAWPDQVRGTERELDDVELLFENSGGRALKTGTPAQRVTRRRCRGRVRRQRRRPLLGMCGPSPFGHELKDVMI
ncbi:MAG: hypothetical protein NVS3B26_28790 [Mycobacteriales bacterium]